LTGKKSKNRGLHHISKMDRPISPKFLALGALGGLVYRFDLKLVGVQISAVGWAKMGKNGIGSRGRRVGHFEHVPDILGKYDFQLFNGEP